VRNFIIRIPNKILLMCRIDDVGRECSTYERDEEYIKSLVGKSEINTPLGRLRRRWLRTII